MGHFQNTRNKGKTLNASKEGKRIIYKGSGNRITSNFLIALLDGKDNRAVVSEFSEKSLSHLKFYT